MTLSICSWMFLGCFLDVLLAFLWLFHEFYRRLLSDWSQCQHWARALPSMLPAASATLLFSYSHPLQDKDTIYFKKNLFLRVIYENNGCTLPTTDFPRLPFQRPKGQLLQAERATVVK